MTQTACLYIKFYLAPDGVLGGRFYALGQTELVEGLVGRGLGILCL